VIARPFTGTCAADFHRTGNRHDYSYPPGETALTRLQHAGVTVIGVGKIADIFAGSGIDQSHPTRSNAEGIATIANLWAAPLPGPHFIFANLVDFDALYGHRRDPAGYAAALVDFDRWLGGFLPSIRPEDLVIFTADHGNDPYHSGTDHTREQVPALTLGLEAPLPAADFGAVARWIEAYFGVGHPARPAC
jgi:phosphopentomutase